MRRARRVAISIAALLGLPVAALAASCTGEDVVAEVRSLEGASEVAFLCLGPPGSSAALRPLSECITLEYETPNDFGDGSEPHLYALVTLQTRGEVAVIDLSAIDGSMLDQDTTTPGENALPVGAQPVAIASTPKGTATFVASAEVGRPGIYALPSEVVRPCEVDGTRCDTPPPTLSSWPACRLEAAPGEMILVADPAALGSVRSTCDSAYDTPVDASGPAFGDIDREGLGRQKLLVTLPKRGEVVVIDAQTVLAAPPGTFELCPIERTLALSGQAPPVDPDPGIMPGPACAVPPAEPPRPAAAFPSTPAGIALSGDRLYIADLTAPLIHVLDVASPCDLSELPPLLPTSREDPERIVVTTQVAVSPQASPDLKRYLYAIDVMDRSLMAFDVSEGSTSVRPLERFRPELDPLQPSDRLRFAAPPTDVVVVQRDEPRSVGQGLAPFGTRCNPDPSAVVCSSGVTTCDLGTLYRTSSDFEDGAGPLQLRGTFAMVALASGQIAVVDIDDYDAPCRGPQTPSLAAGCSTEGGQLVTTNEPSCNVVLPHAPRAGTFILTNDEVGRHEPGIQSFPILTLEDGTVVTDGPKMVATIPASGVLPTLSVGGEVLEIGDSGAIVDDTGQRNTLLPNVEDPRVHVLDQEWAVVYQGALPAFVRQRGDLRLSSFDRQMVDESARFCGGGVQSEAAIRAALATEGLTGPDLDAAARRLADRLHVTEPLADQESSYWVNAACTFQECRSIFGGETTPTPSRDLVVREAYEDRLVLDAPQGVSDETFECCFPTLVSYEIRPGDEWIVVGGASGFLHATIPDPASGGACRPSCDPRLARRRSRVRSTPRPDEATPITVGESDPGAYLGTHFRFAILVPPPGDDGKPSAERDMAFRFTSQGAFIPLRAVLTNEARPNVQPQQIGYAQGTDELFVTDGGLEGLILVPGNLNGNYRQVY